MIVSSHRIDNPVLGDARLRVVPALHAGVPPGVVGADDLDDQVGAAPVLVPAPRVAGVAHEQQIGLAELAFSDAQAQGREANRAAAGADEGRQGQEQALRDGLMTVRGHGRDLEATVRELDQQPGVIGQLEVLRLRPEPLQRLDVDVGVAVRRGDPQAEPLRSNRHGRASPPPESCEARASRETDVKVMARCRKRSAV